MTTMPPFSKWKLADGFPQKPVAPLFFLLCSILPVGINATFTALHSGTSLAQKPHLVLEHKFGSSGAHLKNPRVKFDGSRMALTSEGVALHAQNVHPLKAATSTFGINGHHNSLHTHATKRGNFDGINEFTIDEQQQQIPEEQQKVLFEELLRFYKALNNSLEPSASLKQQIREMAAFPEKFGPEQILRLVYNIRAGESLPEGMPEPWALFRTIVGADYGQTTTGDRVMDEMLEERQEMMQSVGEQKSLFFATNGQEGFDLDSLLRRRNVGEGEEQPEEIISYSNLDSSHLFKQIYSFDLLVKSYNTPKVAIPRRKAILKIFENVKAKFFSGKKKDRQQPYEEFLEYLEVFAPDTWLFAFIAIPQEGRQLLLNSLNSIIADLAASSQKIGGNSSTKPSAAAAVDLQHYNESIFKNSHLDARTVEKIAQFFAIVRNDFARLPTWLTDNFAALFESLAGEGLPVLKKALVVYLQVWERATPADQLRMAQTFPKLAFFYNDEKSMTMNNWALRSARGNNFIKLPLLALLKLIFLNKPKLSQEDHARYGKLRETLLSDIETNEQLFEKISKFFAKAKPLVGHVEFEEESNTD